MIAKDKVKHFYYCIAAAAGSAVIVALVGATWLPAMVAGFLSACAAGLAKEYADKAWGGKFDWCDLLADVAGATVGSLAGLLAFAL